MIYVNGDSWSQRSNIDPDYSWPKLLQEIVNVPVINQSAGCGSNSRILSNLYAAYQMGMRPDLILVGLTSFQRWHLPSKLGSSWNIGPTVINDRTGARDETMLNWWRKYVFDDLEYIYQYYNQIYQMNELGKNYFRCPIIFFNAWDINIVKIHNDIFKTDNDDWIASLVDTSDYAVVDYIECFKFFKDKFKDIKFYLDPWSKFLTQHIDGPTGLHPGHPSPEGHRLICDYVSSIIKQTGSKLKMPINLVKEST
jgi:hypothetical protein